MQLNRLRELAGIQLNEAEEPKKFGANPFKPKEPKEPEVEEEKKEETTDDAKIEVEDEEKKVPMAPTDELLTPVASPIPAPPAVPSAPVSTGTQPVEEPAVDPVAAQPTDPQAPVAVETMSPSQVVKLFFNMRDQVHYFHLQTESFAEHKALNDFYETILDIADKFTEAFQGLYGRAKGEVSITLKDYSPESVVSEIATFSNNIKNLQKQVASNTDLVNLLDELLNACNKTNYLLTLK